MGCEPNQSGQGNVITTSEIGAWTGAHQIRHNFTGRKGRLRPQGITARSFVKSYYGVYDERAKSNAEYQPYSQHKGWFGVQPFH